MGCLNWRESRAEGRAEQKSSDLIPVQARDWLSRKRNPVRPLVSLVPAKPIFKEGMLEGRLDPHVQFQSPMKTRSKKHKPDFHSMNFGSAFPARFVVWSGWREGGCIATSHSCQRIWLEKGLLKFLELKSGLCFLPACSLAALVCLVYQISALVCLVYQISTLYL
jgi:hypothetical protein